MKKLCLGKVSSAELADWFGISVNTLQNHKQKYLEKLKYFATFKNVRGGVEIEAIEIEEYIKDFSKDVEFYLQCVQKEKEHLSSASGIAALAEQSGDPNYDCSTATLERRMRKARDIAFGKPLPDSPQGIYGSCKYIWCIKEYDRPNHYRFFTEEEEKLFDETIAQIYASSPAAVKQEAILRESLRSGEITPDEYFLQIDTLGIDCFSTVIWSFKRQTGKQIVRATEHDIMISAF